MKLIILSFLLTPYLAIAAPIPSNTEVPKEIRKATAKASIVKIVVTPGPDGNEVDREIVCELVSDVSVYDLRRNTIGFRMPKFEPFGNCDSNLNGHAVKVKVGAQLYDGWRSVVLKGPGKFFFGRMDIFGLDPKGSYHWVEAGSGDPKTKSIVASVSSTKDGGNESFLTYIEVYDSNP